MAKLDSDDLKAIKDLIEVTVDEAIERNRLVTQDHIGNLPSKDEFYETMDNLMGELKAIREEVSVLGHQVADHSDRLERIETSLDMASD